MKQKINLFKLSRNDLSQIAGKGCNYLKKDGVKCGCACAYADPDQGGSSTLDNRNANWAGGGLNSPQCD